MDTKELWRIIENAAPHIGISRKNFVVMRSRKALAARWVAKVYLHEGINDMSLLRALIELSEN